MGKESKDNVLPEGKDVAETTSTERPVSVSIATEEDARLLVKNGGFDLDGSTTVFVTGDKNVFTLANMDYAYHHAAKNKLLIFRLDEWTK